MGAQTVATIIMVAFYSLPVIIIAYQVIYRLIYKNKYLGTSKCFICFVLGERNITKTARRHRLARCTYEGDVLTIQYLHDNQETVKYTIPQDLAPNYILPEVKSIQCYDYDVYWNTGFHADNDIFKQYKKASTSFDFVHFEDRIDLYIPHAISGSSFSYYKNVLISINKVVKGYDKKREADACLEAERQARIRNEHEENFSKAIQHISKAITSTSSSNSMAVDSDYIHQQLTQNDCAATSILNDSVLPYIRQVLMSNETCVKALVESNQTIRNDYLCENIMLCLRKAYSAPRGIVEYCPCYSGKTLGLHSLLNHPQLTETKELGNLKQYYSFASDIIQQAKNVGISSDNVKEYLVIFFSVMQEYQAELLAKDEQTRIEAERKAQCATIKKEEAFQKTKSESESTFRNSNNDIAIIKNFYYRNKSMIEDIIINQNLRVDFTIEELDIQLHYSQTEECTQFITELQYLTNMLCELHSEYAEQTKIVTYVVFQQIKKIAQKESIDYMSTVLHSIDFSKPANEILYRIIEERYDISDERLMYGLFHYLLQQDNCGFNRDEAQARKEYDEVVQTQYKKYQEKQKYELFKQSLLSGKAKDVVITITDLDIMTGVQFEEYIAKMFRDMGYIAEMTKVTGDQGIDIIATKDDVHIGIQAKRYSSTVGNSAIQEVVAGLNFYGLSKGMVVTNSYFSKSARELAQKNNIQLWDRKVVKDRLVENLH